MNLAIVDEDVRAIWWGNRGLEPATGGGTTQAAAPRLDPFPSQPQAAAQASSSSSSSSSISSSDSSLLRDPCAAQST